jgi:hypothetical protein
MRPEDRLKIFKTTVSPVIMDRNKLVYHSKRHYIAFINTFVPFRSPSLFYLFIVGVEVIYFHLITLKHTPQSV